MNKLNLTGLTLEEMEKFMQSIGQSRYRADQIFNWIYKKRIRSFEDATNFSKSLRSQLDNIASIGCVKLKHVIQSKDNQTHKFLFELADKNCIESVFMIDGKRRTICLSSQVGCALQCNFCATGKMGFIRNLEVGEIIDQLLFTCHYLKSDVTNVVLMGMGEPFLNYENTINACYIISHDKGISIGKRKITISTSGIIPAIKKFTDEGHNFKLAVSLNAADDKIRNQLMPVNKKYSMNQLINAARYYNDKAKHRITFEYVLIEGVNSSVAEAKKLRALLKNLPCKINIIPYNGSSDENYKRPSERTINEFIKPFLNENIVISVRRSKGDDIEAACGQLYHMKASST